MVRKAREKTTRSSELKSEHALLPKGNQNGVCGGRRTVSQLDGRVSGPSHSHTYQSDLPTHWPLAKEGKGKKKEKVLNRPMIGQRKEAVLFRRHGHGVRASTSRPIAEPAMSRGGPLVVDKRSFRHARHASFHLINDPFPGQLMEAQHLRTNSVQRESTEPKTGPNPHTHRPVGRSGKESGVPSVHGSASRCIGS